MSYNKTCDNFYSQLRDIEIIMDGTSYVIPPEGYSESNNSKGYGCLLLVSTRYDRSTIELGTAFLENFVLSYVYDTGKINIGLNTNAPKGAKIVNPTIPVNPNHSHPAKVGVGIAIVVLLIAAVAIGCWCFHDKRRT